jgi:hypothetical protein
MAGLASKNYVSKDGSKGSMSDEMQLAVAPSCAAFQECSATEITIEKRPLLYAHEALTLAPLF